MRKNFKLVNPATGEEMILPVTPSSWQGEAGRKANSLTMHTVGAVNLPGNRALLDEELDCLLPAHDYPFNSPGAVTNPWYYLERLIRWSDEGTALRFIISDTDVNESVILDPIRYREQDGTGDIYCTIPLRGYRELAAVTEEVTASGNNARAVDGVTVTQTTYTVQPGDTLSAIARKFYGDASLYGKLAAANGIKNANLIYPGQALKIPDAKRLPAASVTSAGAISSKAEETEFSRYTLGVVFAGGKNYFGRATVDITTPAGETASMDVTGDPLKKSIQVKPGSKATVKWSDKNGYCDYFLINTEQRDNKYNVSYLTINKNTTVTIHWTKVRL